MVQLHMAKGPGPVHRVYSGWDTSDAKDGDVKMPFLRLCAS
jgi:hypothetical protein